MLYWWVCATKQLCGVAAQSTFLLCKRQAQALLLSCQHWRLQVGGLGDGLLFAPYVTALAAAQQDQQDW